MSKEMLFEEFNAKGKRLFYTESKECIPPKKDLKQRAEANGYTYKLNGKPYVVLKDEKEK